MDERDENIILALAENRLNVSNVSRVLIMHRNTVLYHINKIKRITGKDPLDFYDLHKLVKMVRDEENPSGDEIDFDYNAED